MRLLGILVGLAAVVVVFILILSGSWISDEFQSATKKDEEDWQADKELPEGYSMYLHNHPKGAHREDAEKALWEKALRAGNLDSYTSFLSQVPGDAAHADEAKQRVAELRLDEVLWKTTKEKGSIDAYRRYLENSHSTSHHSEAIQLMKLKAGSPVAIATMISVLHKWPQDNLVPLGVIVDDGGVHGELVTAFMRFYFGGRIEQVRLPCLRTNSCSQADLLNAFISIAELRLNHPGAIIVANMSWGSYASSPLLERIFSELRGLGFVFVAASGNDGSARCRYPAAYTGVVSVGAVASEETALTSRRVFELAQYSNYGNCVSVYAEDNSAMVRASVAKQLGDIDKDILKSSRTKQEETSQVLEEGVPRMMQLLGTSFTAPKVAGILATALSEHSYLNAGNVLAAVESSCDVGRIDGKAIIEATPSCSISYGSPTR